MRNGTSLRINKNPIAVDLRKSAHSAGSNNCEIGSDQKCGMGWNRINSGSIDFTIKICLIYPFQRHPRSLYFDLIASTGSILAAVIAGLIPATTPKNTAIEVPINAFFTDNKKPKSVA